MIEVKLKRHKNIAFNTLEVTDLIDAIQDLEEELFTQMMTTLDVGEVESYRQQILALRKVVELPTTLLEIRATGE